jgi:hypothetical protein
MIGKMFLIIAACCAAPASQITAQTATDMTALKGLAPVTVLTNTPEGAAALVANYTMTGGIQTGTIRQSALLPFAEQ